MKMGIGIGTDASGVAAQDKRSFVPPSIAELGPKFPQFEIVALIGHGGMGAVYKARQKQLERVVALKILPPGVGEDLAFSDRFTREAKAMARLSHPGIVTIHDFGCANGLYYLVMEFVDGVSLGQLMRTGRVSSREALAIVPQICDALQYAHDQGIVHRDIKPENILLDRQGRVKVADFGLAKLVGTLDEPQAKGATAETAALTQAGKTMGTPSYMAPEQVGDPGAVDHRADIYALGVVFYQMLTGELPGHQIQPPSRKVAIDVRLDEVVLRALEEKPERRYQQVSEVKTMVEAITCTLGKSAPEQVANSRPSGPPAVRRRGVLVIVALAVLAGLLAIFFWRSLVPQNDLFSNSVAVRLQIKVKYAAKEASVQDIVENLAGQAGFRYDRLKSFAQTAPLCQKWVQNVTIDGKTCQQALDQILKPVGLRYQVENGEIVLSRQNEGTHPPKSGASSIRSPIGKGYVTAGPPPTGLDSLLQRLLHPKNSVRTWTSCARLVGHC
jgi:serine/threonine protein kinase